MCKKKNERIKDIIIDHIFDYCYNDIVHKAEGGGISLSAESGEQLGDPVMKSLDDAARDSGNYKNYFGPREVEYCTVLVREDTIHKAFSEKLQVLGIKKSKTLYRKIISAHSFLLARSYISKSKPIESKVKLTEKGLRHYLDGKSFEEAFVVRRNSNIALVVSFISIALAITAFVLSV